MHPWPKILAAIGLLAFVLTGLLGLVDAVANAVLHGLPGGPGPLAALGAMLPSFTLYGWFGLATAVLVALPLVVLMRTRPDADRSVPALATAAALAVVVVIWIGYLVRETPVGVGWEAHLGPQWVPLLLLALGLALLLAVPLRRAMARVGSGSWGRLAILAVIVVAVSLQWPDHRVLSRREHVGDLALGTAPPGAPNVLLVSIDALRRDRLSCIDPEAPPTPHLDGLAAEGRLFTNAWSVSSWTLPSMATLMTGLPPRSLGVTSGIGLPGAAPTLSECARSAGWWTSALVANPYLAEEFGFARGFADFDHTDVIESLWPARRTLLARELNRHLIERTDLTDGRRLAALASRWLRQYRREQPFFYWIHMMDPHMPYRSHADADGRRTPLPASALLERDRFADTAGLRTALPDVSAEVRQTVVDLYDGEVRYADRCVGKMLEALAAAGHADDTWIVIMSDHGEEFFEHGGFEHGHSLMPEVSGVPLIIRPPGGLAAGVRDERPVSLLDLAPSLGRALGWTLPDSLPGKFCLLEDDAGDCTPAGVTILENMLYGPPQQAVLRWPDFRVAELVSGTTAWYDLGVDPGALTPVAAPADAAAVRDRTRALVAGWNERAVELDALGRADTELSEAARRRLRSLGY